MRGSAPHAPQGRAGLRSAPVVAKPTSTGRRATLTSYNKQNYVLLVFLLLTQQSPAYFMPGFALRTIPRWLSALKSVFARFAYIYCTAKGEKSQTMLTTNPEKRFVATKIRHIVCKYKTRKEDENALRFNYTSSYY